MRSKDDIKMIINQDNSIDMHFISSDIHIDPEYPGGPNYGAKIIAPSCGDGKTTLIKYIIKNYFNYGVLVAAGSIEEVKMYGEFIKNEVVGIERNGFTFTEDDYVLLYSENESKQDEYIYSSNPEEIRNRHVVICTHYKLFNDDLRLLVCLNAHIRNLYRGSVYNSMYGSRNMTNARSALGVAFDGYSIADSIPRRQFIIVDEMPRCPMLKKRLNKFILSTLIKYDQIDTSIYEMRTFINHEGKEDEYKHIIKEGEIIKRFYMDDRNSMLDRYNSFVRNTELDLIKGNREIDTRRLESILDTFYDKFNYYTMTCPRDGRYLKEIPEYIDVAYNLGSLGYSGMKTNLWVFDGTGDLTFKGIQGYRMHVPSGNKFQSPIKFHKIDISSGRNFRESTLANNPKKIEDRLNENIDILLNVFKRNPNGKILISCWKTFRFHRIENEFMNYAFSKYLYKEDKAILLELSQYYIDHLTPIVEQMKANGELGSNFEFNFIYYQSGLDRATNQFRDYDSIVFLGEFIVPKTAIDEHNFNMGSKTDHTRYTLHQLVQAVSRLRIRKHRGEPIDVYYTSDWDEKYMILLSFYMSNNQFTGPEHFTMIAGSETDITDKAFLGYLKSRYFQGENNSFDFVKPRWRDIFRTLCEYDTKLESAILTECGYTLTISLNDIFSLLPMSRKDKDKYKNLVNQLKLFKVRLNII